MGRSASSAVPKDARGEGSATGSQVVMAAFWAGRILLYLGITVLLGRVASPEAFGFFAFVASIFVVANTVLDLGSGALVVREITRNPAGERELLEGLMGWRRALGLALGAAVAVMALFEPDPGRRWVLFGAALTVPTMAPGILFCAFQVRQALLPPTGMWLATQAAVVVGALVMWRLDAPDHAYAWLIVAREFLALRALLWLFARRVGYLPRPGLRGRKMRRFFGMATLFGLATLCQVVFFYVDVFLVRWIRGEAELGAYAAAFRPMNQLLTVPGMLMLPLLPLLTMDARGARDRFVRIVRRAAGVLLALGLLGGVAGASLAADLMELLYGGNYSTGPLESVTALRWLCVAFAAVFTYHGFTMGLLADGRERGLVVLGILGVLTNVLGNLCFLPIYGFTAAAATTAGTELAVCLGAVVLFGAAGGRIAPPAVGARELAPAVALGFGLWVLAAPPVVRVAAGGLGGLVGLAVILTGGVSRALRDDLRREEGA